MKSVLRIRNAIYGHKVHRAFKPLSSSHGLVSYILYRGKIARLLLFIMVYFHQIIPSSSKWLWKCSDNEKKSYIHTKWSSQLLSMQFFDYLLNLYVIIYLYLIFKFIIQTLDHGYRKSLKAFRCGNIDKRIKWFWCDVLHQPFAFRSPGTTKQSGRNKAEGEELLYILDLLPRGFSLLIK